MVLLCLVAACTSGRPGSRSEDRPGPTRTTSTGGSEVQVLLTTADGRARLADRRAVSFHSRTTAAPDIVVEDQRRYQQFDGVGASLTGASAAVLGSLSGEARHRVMEDIFSSHGAGLTILRQPVGANDFSVGSYSYDDVPTGQSDPDLSRFSFGADAGTVLPLVREAAAIAPSLAVVLSPWSAPAWMKSTGALVGGTLRPEDADAYARYLAKAVQAYDAAGAPVRGLTVQNEPSFSPPGYAGMTLDQGQQRSLLVDRLPAALRAAGVSPHVWALDDNFDRWPEADALLSDPAVRAVVTGVAFHCYSGDVSALRELRARHPGVPVAVSECSGGSWSPDFSRDLRFDAHTLIVQGIRNGASWLVKWNLALDPAGGPTNGGCPSCSGLVTVDPATGQVSRSATYDAWAHVGRFVRPHARVIGSTTYGEHHLETVAFLNPDGSHALVAYNDAGTAAHFDVRWRGRAFTYALAPGSLATFSW